MINQPSSVKESSQPTGSVWPLDSVIQDPVAMSQYLVYQNTAGQNFSPHLESSVQAVHPNPGPEMNMMPQEEQ